MRTLKEALLAAAAAIDQAGDEDWCIRIWPFAAAPPELRALSQAGGDEDWLAVVPDKLAGEYFPWPGTGFGSCGIESHPIAGALVYIGYLGRYYG